MNELHKRFRERFTMEFDNGDERWSVFLPSVKPEEVLDFIEEVVAEGKERLVIDIR